MRSRKLLLLGLIWCTAGYGLTSDNQQPIVITSNTLNGNLNQRVAVFSGSVVATQGTRQLHSDQAYAYFNQAGKVDNLKAVGKPAKTTEVLDTKGNKVFGQALIIEYFPLKSLIQYEQQAMLEENGNIFKGDLITYNIINQIVASPKAADNTGNTTIILPPYTPPQTKANKS